VDRCPRSTYHHTGGHCGYLGGEVSGANEIVAAVRERVERQVDVVTVMASGGMVTTGIDVFVLQFSIEEFRQTTEMRTLGSVRCGSG
jgi:uncharacterized protein (DUF39 family)